MLISGLLDKEEPPARAWIEGQLRPPRKTSRVAPSQPSGPIVVPQRSHRQLEHPGDVEASAGLSRRIAAFVASPQDAALVFGGALPESGA